MELNKGFEMRLLTLGHQYGVGTGWRLKCFGVVLKVFWREGSGLRAPGCVPETNKILNFPVQFSQTSVDHGNISSAAKCRFVGMKMVDPAIVLFKHLE